MILMADEVVEKTDAEKAKKTIKAQDTQKAVPAAPRARAAPKQKQQQEVNPSEHLLFDRYSYKDIVITDQSLVNYVNLVPRRYPNIYGRRSNAAYYNAHINIVERLTNKLMRGGTGRKIGGKVIRTEGRLQGKKLKSMRIVRDAFAIIHEKTGQNPIQVLVNALQNAAPIEDTTRVRYGGIVYNIAVDISAVRRLNVALKNMALSAITGSFKNRKSIADALAAEIILTANKDPASYAIRKKVEAERIARSAR